MERALQFHYCDCKYFSVMTNKGLLVFFSASRFIMIVSFCFTRMAKGDAYEMSLRETEHICSLRETERIILLTGSVVCSAAPPFAKFMPQGYTYNRRCPTILTYEVLGIHL
jgi:hypothetical protein